MGVHWKIWFWGLVHKKNKRYIGGFCKKGGLGQLPDLRGGLAKKGGVYEGNWYLNVRYGELNHRLTSLF